jgi:hypothetical protein
VPDPHRTTGAIVTYEQCRSFDLEPGRLAGDARVGAVLRASTPDRGNGG